MNGRNRFFKGGRRILFVGILFVLLIPMPVFAGALLGGSFIVADDVLREVNASVAYNSQDNEYLVVWHNERANYPDIRAQRLDALGNPIGNPFYISGGQDAKRRFPDVAYNSVHNQYLVVWEAENAPPLTYNMISARRVSGDGQVLDATDITLVSPSNLSTPSAPAVAYASTSDRYLVVWAETSHVGSPMYAIFGQVMKEDGSKDGFVFDVSAGNELRKDPDLAYNRHANRYLVVWAQDNGFFDIMGRQVHGYGGTFGANDENYAYFSRDSERPSVACIPTSPTNIKCLVVWRLDHAPGDSDIYGRVINEDGTIAGDAHSSISSNDDTAVAVAANEMAQEYLVVWRSSEGIMSKPIKGQIFDSQGNKKGGVFSIPGVAADHPAVSSGPLGDFLIVWDDMPLALTHENLYGQLFGKRQYVPQILK